MSFELLMCSMFSNKLYHFLINKNYNTLKLPSTTSTIFNILYYNSLSAIHGGKRVNANRYFVLVKQINHSFKVKNICCCYI